MKKTLFTILMAASVFAYSDEYSSGLPAASDLKSLPNLPLQDIVAAKQGFFYVRFTAGESDMIHTSSVLPGLGVGYRRLSGVGAADISINGIGHAQRKSGRFFWTAPKASYMHYLQPDAKKSPYLGAGLAWGGVDSRTQDFIGIIPSVMVGYEFVRKSVFLGFAELTVSQPALSVYRKGSFPGPCVEFSTGIGF